MTLAVQFVTAALLLGAVQVGQAQVICGSSDIVAQAVPAVAAPGQPVELRITNNSAQQISFQFTVYDTIFAGVSCIGAEPVVCGFCFQCSVALQPGDTYSGAAWNQIDDFGLQVPSGEYSFHIGYGVLKESSSAACRSRLDRRSRPTAPRSRVPSAVFRPSTRRTPPRSPFRASATTA